MYEQYNEHTYIHMYMKYNTYDNILYTHMRIAEGQKIKLDISFCFVYDKDLNI